MIPIPYRILMMLTPTFDAKSSRNNLIFATVRRDSPYYAAVRFQEQIESAFTKMLALPPALAAALLIHPLAALPVIVAVVLACQAGALTEQIELRGQSAETWVRATIYGEDYDSAELANARQLDVGSYADKGAFKGQSVDQIQARLRAWRPWAARMGRHFEKSLRRTARR